MIIREQPSVPPHMKIHILENVKVHSNQTPIIAEVEKYIFICFSSNNFISHIIDVFCIIFFLMLAY